MANVLLGVCGGIAAYKSCEVVRLLRQEGHRVQVIMTEAAQKFISPLTFESLTENPVHVSLFDGAQRGTAHIHLARWADIILVAPTTADTLAKFALGQAVDLLSNVYLAFEGEVVLAPAMNTKMWKHLAVQANINLLKERGHLILGPSQGDLACGETGMGRMLDPEDIVQDLPAQPWLSKLRGKKVLISGGATREYLDPVRFLSSPSTGKMALAFAKEAERRGAEVTLVHAHLANPIQLKGKTIAVENTAEMAEAILSIEDFDVFVSAAAVSDFTWQNVEPHKIKKTGDHLSLELKPTPDILAEVSKRKRPNQYLIGFAAETKDVEKHGQNKMEAKKLDLMIANKVYKDKEGFTTETTSTLLLFKNGREELKNVSKSRVAERAWDVFETLFEC